MSMIYQQMKLEKNRDLFTALAAAYQAMACI